MSSLRFSTGLLLLVACSSEYELRLSFDPAGLVDSASLVEVGIVDSCQGQGGSGPLLASPIVRFTPDESAPSLGSVDVGERGLVTRLLGSDCEILASGCAPVELDRFGGGTLRVSAGPANGNACASGQVCSAGRCVGANVDASVADAMDDAGPDDARPEFDSSQEDTGRPLDPPSVATTCWLRAEGCSWSVPGTFEFLAESDDVLRNLPSNLDNPVFSPDGCSLLYGLSGDLQIAQRVPGEPFDAGVAIEELNTEVEESRASISPDGLELLFTRRELGISNAFRATRATEDAPWSLAVRVDRLNQVGEDTYDLFLVPHGLRVYLARPPVDAASEQDIWVSERASPSERFSEPRVVLGEETPFAAAEPSASADERALLIITRLAGDPMPRAYYSTRPDWNAEWSDLRTLPGTFFAAGDESVSALSPDGCEVLVERDGSWNRLVYAAP